MIRHPFLAICVLTLLSGCGGGSSEVPTALQLDGKNVLAQAQVTLAPPSDTGCTLLLVTAEFTADPPPLPGQFAVHDATLLRNGQEVWSGPVSQEDSRIDAAGVLWTVARACAPADLAEGQPVTVIHGLEAAGARRELRSDDIRVQVVQ